MAEANDGIFTCKVCGSFIEEASYYYGGGEYAHLACGGSFNSPTVKDMGWMGGSCCNGTPYRPSRNGWVVDGEAQRFQREHEAAEHKEKAELVWALRSRIATEQEMQRAEQLGTNLFISMRGGMSNSYRQEDVDRQFNELMLQQFRLRRVAEQA